MATEQNRFQILCLTGGGYRGLFSATILAGLEARAGKPLAQCFDLIAGTSIGGILALGLALEKKAEQMVEAFEKHGQSIFSNRPAPRGKIQKWYDKSRYLTKPKYNGTGLRAAITSIVGTETKLEDALHPVIVPAVNVSAGKPQLFKTPHHRSFETDYKEFMVEVALATSAAPTIFPLAKIGSSYYADGGLYANAPDTLALHEAEHFLKVGRSQIHILSIGTTGAKFSLSHRGGPDLGLLAWGEDARILQVSSSAQQQCEAFMMNHRLGERYVRIDKDQSKEQQLDIALDVATNAAQEMLKALGTEAVKESLGNEQVQTMLRHQARAPQFFHGKRANNQG